jgi:hypothetical protein
MDPKKIYPDADHTIGQFFNQLTPGTLLFFLIPIFIATKILAWNKPAWVSSLMLQHSRKEFDDRFPKETQTYAKNTYTDELKPWQLHLD